MTSRSPNSRWIDCTHSREDWHQAGDKGIADQIHSKLLPGAKDFGPKLSDELAAALEVFDAFSSEVGDYRFNRTIVPVTRANYGAGELVSRLQAKRLLARVDQFEIVAFDFEGVVEVLGQSFADEIFRVYARAHPNIELLAIHAAPRVAEMIARAKAEPLGAAS